MSRLFLDYCAGADAVRPFFGSLPGGAGWQERSPLPGHWPELVELVAAQNPQPTSAPALDALRSGAGTVVTGQQVGLFGGPLLTALKASTAVARAREATTAGKPHAALFWLASEDHDFAEISSISVPAGKELAALTYGPAPPAALPVGRIELNDSILHLVDRVRELFPPSEAVEALAVAYRPGRTFAQAFAEFYSRAFGAKGLLILDASSREFHRLGAPVLCAALERADELHAALVDRSRALEAAGYHAQVALPPQSSLLFLIDGQTGARQALRRMVPTPDEPQGLWRIGNQRFSTADLAGILESEPERISPSALLRPVFQDFLLGTSLVVGGPAEIAYFAQSDVLYERILGRRTPSAPRLFATLIEAATAELLRRHLLTPEGVMAETAETLATRLAERSMPPETKARLDAASGAFEAELDALLAWMHSQDRGLGQSAETAAGKMRYQMGRLRALAANFQLQRENTLARQAQSICQAIAPGGVPQERVHAAVYYFARYGLELARVFSEQAASCNPGHALLWL